MSDCGCDNNCEQRKFGPKKEGHPSIGQECPACHEEFIEGDYTTLISLGPGDDEEAREHARECRAYNAIAIEIHWACVTGHADEERESKDPKTHLKIVK